MLQRSMFRYVIAPMMLGVAVTAVTVQAQSQPKLTTATPTPATPAPVSDEVNSKALLEKQQELLRKYKSLTEDLLTLVHRFEKSPRVEDQDKAKLIRKAIEVADKEGVDNKFQALLRILAGKNGTITLINVNQAKNENEDLVRVLREIYDILNSDDELARNRAEQRRLEKALAELKSLIRDTQVTKARVESGKVDPTKLAKDQEKNAKKNDDLAKRFEGKEATAKDAKGGDGKGKDGKGMGDGMGKGKDGKGGDGMGKGGMGGMGGEGAGGQPNQPSQPKTPGAEKVRQAVPDQEQAKQELDKKKNADAAQKQSDATKKLQEAQVELEKRLKQLREEELERLLANLEARVAKMYQMQMEVYMATKAIDAIVTKSESKKPEKVEIQKSQTQADKENDIIGEANKAIDILKQEGSAVAFPRVFEETVIDMTRVRERLNQVNVGDDTQYMEKSILDSLKEMLDALKKAQQDLQQSKGQPSAGDGPPPDQKLLDEIAELKMIRSLQVKVNERTKRQSLVKVKEGDARVVEQVDDPQTKVELKDLANRQVKIEEMARDLATGKNK